MARAVRLPSRRLATRLEDEDGNRVVGVSGRLAAAGATLLRDRQAQTEGRVVDLTDLLAASTEGLAALREVTADGVRLRHASPYLALRLASPPENEERPDLRDAAARYAPSTRRDHR